MFAESSGERIGLAEERQGAVDSGVGTGKGQTEKMPKTTRTPKLNQKSKLALLLTYWAMVLQSLQKHVTLLPWLSAVLRFGKSQLSRNVYAKYRDEYFRKISSCS